MLRRRDSSEGETAVTNLPTSVQITGDDQFNAHGPIRVADTRHDGPPARAAALEHALAPVPRPKLFAAVWGLVAGLAVYAATWLTGGGGIGAAITGGLIAAYCYLDGWASREVVTAERLRRALEAQKE